MSEIEVLLMATLPPEPKYVAIKLYIADEGREEEVVPNSTVCLINLNLIPTALYFIDGVVIEIAEMRDISSISAIDETIVESKVTLLVPDSISVQLSEHVDVQVQASISTLIYNPHRSLSPSSGIRHLIN